jgi:hypothetical protein
MFLLACNAVMKVFASADEEGIMVMHELPSSDEEGIKAWC